MDVIIVVFAADRLAAPCVVQERPHQLSVNRQIVGQQKSIVAALAGDIAVAHGFAEGNQRVDYFLRLLRREQPVARETDDQPAALGLGQMSREFRRILADIEEIHGQRQLDIAVGVESFHEFITLIGEIGSDAKFFFEFGRQFPGLQSIRFEFFSHGFGGQIGNVAEHAGEGQSRRGCGAFVDVLPVSIISIAPDCVAAHDIERKCLSRQAGARSKRDGSGEAFRMACRPRHNLMPAHGSANRREEAGHSYVIDEPELCFHHVQRCDCREVRAIALSGCGIPVVGAGGSTAPSQNIRANDEVTIRVDGFAGPNGYIPPPGLILRIMARYVRVAAKRVTDQDCIVFGAFSRP